MGSAGSPGNSEETSSMAQETAGMAPPQTHTTISRSHMYV